MYCSLSDIEEKLDPDKIIELTNDANRAIDDIDLTDVDDACLVIVNSCIKAAETEINTELGARYKVPFSAVPDQIVIWCTEIAIYQLFLRRRRQLMDETVLAQYKLVKTAMKRLSDGYGELIGAVAIQTEAGSGNIQGNKKAIDKIFNKKLTDQF